MSRREEPELWWGSVLVPGTEWGQEHTQESGMEEMGVRPSQHLVIFFSLLVVERMNQS